MAKSLSSHSVYIGLIIFIPTILLQVIPLIWKINIQQKKTSTKDAYLPLPAKKRKPNKVLLSILLYHLYNAHVFSKKK